MVRSITDITRGHFESRISNLFTPVTSRQPPVSFWCFLPRVSALAAQFRFQLIISPCGVLIYGLSMLHTVQNIGMNQVDPDLPTVSVGSAAATPAQMTCICSLRVRKEGDQPNRQGGQHRNEKWSKHACCLRCLLCLPSAVFAASSAPSRRRVPVLSSGKQPRRASLSVSLCTSDAEVALCHQRFLSPHQPCLDSQRNVPRGH